MGISLLRNNRAKEIETKFGATNFAYSATKSWNISGFGILSTSKTELETKSQTTILDSGDQEKRDENTNQKNNLGLFKLSSTYKPNDKFQFDYDILTKLTKQEEYSDLFREQIVQKVPTSEDIFTAKNKIQLRLIRI